MSAITSSVNGYETDRVYGRDIKTWSIDGTSGKTFADVIAFASIRQAAAVENMTGAVADMMELRQQKVTDIGNVLAILAEAIGSMDTGEDDPDDRYSEISTLKLSEANTILAKYGMDQLTLGKGSQINYTNASRAQTRIQTALDTESNDLNQMMTQLEGLVTKRDNSFSVAAKVIEKSSQTATSTIRAYGT